MEGGNSVKESRRVLGRRARARGGALAALTVALAGLCVLPAAAVEPYDGYETAVKASGAVTQYRFDDAVGSSTLADSIGTDTATNSGITLGGEGPFRGSKSGSFSSEAYASLGSNPIQTTKVFTAEAWINWNGGTSYGQPVFFFGTTSAHMLLTPASTATGHPLTFEFSSGSSSKLVTTTKLAASAWKYVVVTETSEALRLYVNGAEVGKTSPVGEWNPAFIGATTNNFLGKSSEKSVPHFAGKLSNVAFYTSALTSKEVEEHYYAAEHPVNTVAPSISGNAKDENTLTAAPGTWVGLTPIEFAYQWQRCNEKGESCGNIAGATGTTYIARHEDVGVTLKVLATGSSVAGTGSAGSAATSKVEPSAPANTGLPVTSGEAKDGQLLSVSTGTWSGTPPFTYSYAWESCSKTGGSCKSITGATSASYRIVSSEIGKTIRSIVTAKNAAGAGSATTEATTVIAEGPPVSTGAPTISGVSEEGHVLSASTGAWAGTAPFSYTYQWQRCSEKGEGCANVSGAMASSYTLGSEDVAHTVRVVVTATNKLGSSNATSAVNAEVAGRPVSTENPAITGTPEVGQTLSASTGGWRAYPTPSFAYQWQRCNEKGEGCANIAGATTATYSTATADFRETLRVTVTATNSAGSSSATSGTTAVVTAKAPANTGLPTASGGAVDGQTLTASPGTWTGTSPITYSYEWQRCNWLGVECQSIEGATGQSYVVGTADRATTVRVVVTATNVAGSAQASSAITPEVALGPPSELEAPSVAGIAAVGQTLHANPGQWGGSEPQIAYQWERCNAAGIECTSIAGATSGDYAVQTTDAGATIRAMVGAANALGSVTALSQATPSVGAAAALEATAAPSITGTAQNGQTLTAVTGSWIGHSPISYGYQWQRCNSYGLGCQLIEGASSSSYTLKGSDVGSTVRLTVTASSVADGDASITTASTPSIAESVRPVEETQPGLTGSGLVGQTLAANPGTWSGESPISYSYQWQRCNAYSETCSPITGATASTYTSTEADATSSVRVIIKATNGQGATEAPSAPISVAATALANTAPPSIAGSTAVGSELTANPGIWTANGTISYAYQWQRCNDKGESCINIEGATASGYRLAAVDSAQTIRLLVTAKASSSSTTLVSQVTPGVTSEPQLPVEVLPPAIEGSATEGDTLTAQPGTWLGTEAISYAYQWRRCNSLGEECGNIEGATASTYVLGKLDVGSTIRVLVTASNVAGFAEATSGQTEMVGAPGPPTNTEAPAIGGTDQQGQRLFASNGLWSGSRPLTYFYRWERCNSAGEACNAIEGATKPSYILVAADVGADLRLRVTATNSLGSGAAFTAVTSAVASSTEASAGQAVELAESTDPSVIAQATTATLEGEPVKPTAADTGEAISSEATLTGTSASKETPGEFAVATAAGELSLAPVGTAANATVTPTIVNGSSAVYAGTSAQTDTIVRPEPLGATTMLQLRSAQAPTTFSWEVTLGTEQELEKLANGSIAVVEKQAGSYLEGELGGEGFEGAGKEGSAESEGAGYGAQAADEEFGTSVEEAGLLEHLGTAPTTSTSPKTPRSGELHPQETRPQYESESSALSYAESHATGTVLMVIAAPTVMDATGHTVPASLSVDGNTVTMTLSPSGETVYPTTAALTAAAPSSKRSTTTPHSHRGLSDEQKSAFAESEREGKSVAEFDSRLKTRFKVESGRLIVDFNASPHSVALHEWLTAVQTAHLKPLVTFRACVPEAPNYGTGKGERIPCPPGPSPTSASFPGYYYNHVYALMKELIKDGVRTFGAWNEPDQFENPLHHNPERAALLWGEAQHATERLGCGRHCAVVAGEFAGYKKGYVEAYLNTSLRDAKRGLPTRRKPRYWGLHDYNDLEQVRGERQNGKLVIAKTYANVEANGFSSTVKRRRIGGTHLWLTEQGVKVETPTSPTGHTRLTESHELQRLAAQDFLRLASSAARFERVYYYQYKGPSKTRLEEQQQNKRHEFDSGMLAGEGIATEPQSWRPAYCVLALGDNGCPASSVTKGPVSGKVASTSATVLLDVVPEGVPTTYEVEFGTTTAYGQTTTPVQVTNAEGPQSETVTLSGLRACTTYHYQAEAENEANEGKLGLGGDQTFTTTGCGASEATSIASGREFSCGVTGAKKVACWGGNQFGQLGNGTTTNSTTPVTAEGIATATAVTASLHACALLAAGSLTCWGDNESGELGDGTTTNHSSPTAVAGLEGVTAVDAGPHNTCALLAGGSLDCWGYNEFGEVGDSTTVTKQTPTRVSGITTAVAVTIGDYHTCALLASGHVECWGFNVDGQLGTGGTENSSTPVEVEGITNAVAVSAAEWGRSTCALLATGTADCWGHNFSGDLGTGSNIGPEKCREEIEQCSRIPRPVVGLTQATAISVGGFHACALLESGGIDCWGAGGSGQLGNGETGGSFTPVPVSGLTEATAVSAGGFHTCGLLSTGHVQCWGENNSGQLGNGTTENSATPVLVSPFP